MKKISLLFGLLMLFAAFTCDNEPLEGDFSDPDPDLACVEATQDTAAATAAFVDATDTNYTELCNTYKNALEAQIIACGDDTGSLQALIDALGNCIQDFTGFNCNGLQLSDVAGPGFVCNYDTYSSLQVNNVYMDEEGYPTDENNDGIDDHYLSRIYLTDGTAVLDGNNVFQNFSVTPTYILEIVLFSIGTNGLVADNYKPLAFVDWHTESYLSLAVSDFSINNCESDFFSCENTMILLSGIASVTGNPGSFELCYDLVLDFDDNCIKGTYSGDYIPIVLN